jgi:hypothetical protein
MEFDNVTSRKEETWLRWKWDTAQVELPVTEARLADPPKKPSKDRQLRKRDRII